MRRHFAIATSSVGVRNERQHLGHDPSQHKLGPLNFDLGDVGGARKPRHERNQQFLPQIVLEGVIEAQREQRNRARERRRQIPHPVDGTIGIARGDDGRLVDAGPAVRSRKFVAAAQQLPLQHALEIGGGSTAARQHVQQAGEIEHCGGLPLGFGQVWKMTPARSRLFEIWQQDWANIRQVDGLPTASN
jgi:hypothetical protein